MSNKELVESIIPDFIDVTVESSECEQEHIEEIIVISGMSDGDKYGTEIAFEETDDGISELKQRQLTSMLTRITEVAIEEAMDD